jgi:hypothetical protein
MKQFVFKGPTDESKSYCITAESLKDAIFDLTAHLMELNGVGDVSYWIDNPDMVYELK